MHSNDNKWKKVSSDGLKASMKLQGFALSVNIDKALFKNGKRLQQNEQLRKGAD